MQTFPHHNQEDICPGCEARLNDAHPYMKSWFQDMKSKNPTMHCSWVYRDKDSQNEAASIGASKFLYPHSKHNVSPSEAIDVFQIIDGKAVFDAKFCTEINDISKLKYSLRWGGLFRELGDYGHFEMHNVDEAKLNA